MHEPTRILVLTLALLLALPLTLSAEEEDPATIPFFTTLTEAFAAAKEKDLPLMICINSRRVDGGRLEPAAQELRMYTYKAPGVVAKAKHFVCAFLTSEGTSDDFGELRLRFGIDGEIVSPQHVFAYPDGKLIYREEFWPYGKGQGAVDKLVEMMEKALAKDRARRSQSPLDPQVTPKPPDEQSTGGTPPAPPPEDDEARAAWIAKRVEIARGADEDARQAACEALVEADAGDDCLAPLLELLAEMKKNPDVQVDIVRALGRPGLELAVKPLAKLLGIKHDEVRANAAVSLEYIGSKAAASDLRKRAAKEKDETIANHMYRALGRCGAGNAKARSALVKQAGGAKTDRAAYGAIIGLAYFGPDPKSARAVEGLLQRAGVPSGGRGAWRSGTKRALLTWCLTEVGFGDEKSEAFLRERFVPAVMSGARMRPLADFFKAAADCCGGDEDARGQVIEGVLYSLGRGRGSGGNALSGDARRGRDGTGFEPKAAWSTSAPTSGS